MTKKQMNNEKAPKGDRRNNQVRSLTCKCCLVTEHARLNVISLVTA